MTRTEREAAFRGKNEARKDVVRLLRACRKTTGHAFLPNDPDGANAFGIMTGLWHMGATDFSPSDTRSEFVRLAKAVDAEKPEPSPPTDLPRWNLTCGMCGHVGDRHTFPENMTSVQNAVRCPSCGSTKVDYNRAWGELVREAAEGGQVVTEAMVMARMAAKKTPTT